MDISNDSLQKFKENVQKAKKAKEDLAKFMEEMNDISRVKDAFFKENEEVFILKALMDLDLEKVAFPRFARIQLALGYSSQSGIVKYSNHLKERYQKKTPPEKPVRPERVTKESIKDYSAEVAIWNKEAKVMFDWNQKLHAITEYVDSINFTGIYGDETVDATNLPFVYFKFLNTDKDEIDIFLQELKNCPVQVVTKIICARIEDITDKLPGFIQSGKEVRIHFNSKQEVDELLGSVDHIGSVYEKYVIKNRTMKMDGGEWGSSEKRKENLQNPTVPNFGFGISAPVTLNSGDEYEEDPKFHEKDYKVNVSDCYWGLFEQEDADTLFAIVPKEFWDNYKSLLYNPNMEIEGISDDKKWKADSLYFKYFGNLSDGKSALLSLGAEFLDLEDYFNNTSIDDDENDDDDDSEFSEYEKGEMLWAVNKYEPDDHYTIIITPKKYWEEENCLADWHLSNIEGKVISGYTLGDLMESHYEMCYSKTTEGYVPTLSEIRTVMEKSGFVYSFDMQKFVDEDTNEIVNSNDFKSETKFFDELSKKSDLKSTI